jgi:hypothetical protein
VASPYMSVKIPICECENRFLTRTFFRNRCFFLLFLSVSRVFLECFWVF